jgi:sugar fermentation stimulation protein A
MHARVKIFVAMKPLLNHPAEFRRGRIVDRPSRFTLRVEIGSKTYKAYLANPGKLSTVIAPGREVLCEPTDGEKRKNGLRAFAVKVKNFYVTVNSAFANEIFSAALKRKALREFLGHEIAECERRLTNGRIDFVLREPSGRQVYVEIKSCTHVERGVAKFPDRPTERGRRHLMLLINLARKGGKCYVIFIIQRPDAEEFRPFVEVDPEFAGMLEEAAKEGVMVRAFSTQWGCVLSFSS